MLKLATLCYVKRPGQTLMLHRIKKADDMHAGKWNGLGGKLEPGETPEECARREILEESGLDVIALNLRGVLTFPEFRPGEDWYAFIFTAHEFTGALFDPEIGSAEGVLEWIDDHKLLDLPLWEGDRIFIPWLNDNRLRDRFFSGKFVYVDGKLIEHSVSFYPPLPALERQPEPVPVYTPQDDTYCWVCGGPVLKRHCKIVCQACGFTRDCSDP